MTKTSVKIPALALLLYLFLLSPSVFCQGNQTAQKDVDCDAELKASVVKGVSRLLVDNYIFPETAKKMEEHLMKQLAEGKYDGIKDVNAFAGALTRDLRSISNDKHIRVTYSPDTVKMIRAGSSRSEEEREKARIANIERQRQGNFGFRKLEILEGNIGYLDLTGFTGLDEAAETIVAAMNFLANSNAVIIDLRNNGGGDPYTIQIISSYFLDETTHLNSFEWRGADTIRQFWTLPYVPGKKMYDTDLYILTSARTFSAAEEFTYNLKNLERATIVGETTGGGAHPGGNRIVDDNFLVWVPGGRAINPITKTNWEGTGIEPHIKVDRALALDKAHSTALEKLMEKTEDEAQKHLFKWAMDGLKAKLEPVEVEAAILQKYTGKYTRGEIILEKGRLVFKTAMQAYEMLPLTRSYFVLKDYFPVRIEFVPDDTGKGYVVKAHMNNGSTELVPRIK